MNAIVIGLGSMGRRRIRLIKSYKNDINIIGIDTIAERRNSVEHEFGIETDDDIESICGKYDISVAFVCTSPLSHADIIKECLNRNCHVFTEINLVDDGYEEIIALSREKGRLLFLSSTFLYRKEIQYIKSIIDGYRQPVNYMYHVGQYLPDWHPWENYKSFFVGNRRSNGCRELLAIELPWITDVFGTIEKWYSAKGKISGLEIDYPDSYNILLEHSNGNRGMILVDVVSRKAERNLRVISEEGFLSWEGTPESLVEYDINDKKGKNIDIYDTFDRKEGYSDFIIEDAYLGEIVDFFDAIETHNTTRYSFEKDKEILAFINKVEGDMNYDSK